MEGWNSFTRSLYSTFIVENRWMMFVRGLGVTLLISLFAVFLGLILGSLAAAGKMAKMKPRWLCKIINFIANGYISIIRGTPTMVQLLIIYFIIFAPININQIVVAVIAFGLNSGAYVAEIIRGGVLSVNIGQTEAGRSLGLTPFQTLRHIVAPQAVKNIMPALNNEFIVLIKETATIGYIAKIDLTAAALQVQSRTYDYIVPLLTIAVIYFVVIKILTIFLNKIEKRLRRSDIR